jgi:acyl-CoA reductase-like NAD-dependent aldehyde dehydrogenase
MRMFIGGEWTSSPATIEVVNPYDGGYVDAVPQASAGQVEDALASAVAGAEIMKRLDGYSRATILRRAADLVDANQEDLARLVTREEGKPITEARSESRRIGELLRLSAFEGTQARGESLPIDSHIGGDGRVGFTVREPCGVVAALTPFNFPLLLVAHKVGPALAAGNAVVLKPASTTPLSALRLVELLLEAGLPPLAIQCVTGSGAVVGRAIAGDARVRKVSFTGSVAVGEEITRVAGIKRLTMELGANCPLVVLDDADLQTVARATVTGGYSNAGQVCISTQRVIVQRTVYADFLDVLQGATNAVVLGDPQLESTQLGPMISEGEVARVASWIREATGSGGRVIAGGEHEGAVHTPTVIADVTPDMKVAREELFGPAVAVMAADSVDHALELCNISTFGLGAGIFTHDVTKAMQFALGVSAGSVMVNASPTWRADLMPYGGHGLSGFGLEGPRYAVQEMTENRTIVIHGLER